MDYDSYTPKTFSLLPFSPYYAIHFAVESFVSGVRLLSSPKAIVASTLARIKSWKKLQREKKMPDHTHEWVIIS